MATTTNPISPISHVLQEEGLQAAINILQIEHETGQNTWFVMRNSNGTLHDIINDVETVRKFASTINVPIPEVASNEILLCLIISTLNSLLHRVSPFLATFAVKENLLTPERGLSYVLGNDSYEVLAEAIVGLAPYLTTTQLQEALDIIKRTKPQRNSSNSSYRSPLRKLAPYLSKLQIQEAFDVALTTNCDEAGCIPLAGLIPYLNDSQRQKVFNIVKSTRRLRNEALDILVALAPYLSVEELANPLGLVNFIADNTERRKVLLAVMPYLSDTRRQEVLSFALELAREEEYETNKISALVSLSEYLPEDQKYEVLLEVLGLIKSGRYHSDIIEILRSVLPGLQESQKLQILREVLSLAKKIGYDLYRYRSVVELLPFLPEPMKQEAIDYVQDSSRKMEYIWGQTTILAKLIPYLTASQSQEELTNALKAVGNCMFIWTRSESLLQLAPYLSEDLMNEALELVKRLDHPRNSNSVLIGLFKYLSVEQRQKALLLVRADRLYGDIPTTLISLARYLPDLQKREILQDALTITTQLHDDKPRLHALLGLAPYLSETLLLEICKNLVVGKSDALWSINFVERASNLPSTIRLKLIDSALENVQNNEDISTQYFLIGKLLPQLPPTQKENLLQKAFGDIRGIQQEWGRATALKFLSPHLSATQREMALEIAISIRSPKFRYEALISQVSCSPETIREDIIQEALRVARNIDDVNYRRYAFGYIIPLLIDPVRQELVRYFVDNASTSERMNAGVYARCDMFTYLTEEEKDRITAKVISIIKKEEFGLCNPIALSGIFSFLSSEKLAEILEESKNIPADWLRSRFLIEFIPYLNHDQRKEVVELVLDGVRKEPNDSSRALLYTTLFATLDDVPFSLWKEALEAHRLLNREDVLQFLSLSGEHLYRFGGQALVDQTATTIMNVSRWWV